MKITVTFGGKSHTAKQPYENADHVVLEALACPSCKHAAPLKVSGSGNHIESHDTYAAEAVALCCRATIGKLRVKLSTIFGLEEDEAVLLHSRCRVY